MAEFSLMKVLQEQLGPSSTESSNYSWFHPNILGIFHGGQQKTMAQLQVRAVRANLFKVWDDITTNVPIDKKLHHMVRPPNPRTPKAFKPSSLDYQQILGIWILHTNFCRFHLKPSYLPKPSSPPTEVGIHFQREGDLLQPLTHH